MPALPSVTIECETVTPLFLGGADPRGTPELRAPSLRGALRYWFLALAGFPIKRLQQEEPHVFGNQQQASPLRGTVSAATSPPSKTWQPGQWPPGSGGGGPGQVNGLAYLGFAFRREKDNPARRAIDAGWPFQITLTAKTAEVLAKASAAFWALCYFGGLGSRTRRGFGGLRVLRASGDMPAALPALALPARTPEELATYLADGLRAAQALIGASPGGGAVAYTTLRAASASACVLGHVWPTWHDVLYDVGQLLAAHRQGLALSLAQLREVLGQRGAQPSQAYPRAGFGLPIVYYDLRTGLNATLEATTLSRRASPLWIRPIRLASNHYAVLLWLSSAPFWPDKTQLKARVGQQTLVLQGEVPLGGVQQFIDACRAR